MKKEQKNFILVFFLAIFIMTNFVSAIEITSCIPNNLKLNSGINQPVTFQVKADTGGYFYGGIECNQGVSATFPGFQIGAQEIQTINTQLISSNPNKADLNYNCILTVRGLGDENSCSFSGVVKYNTGFVCAYPGKTSCDGNDLYFCNDEGNDNVFWKTCQKECVWGIEGYQCEEDKSKEEINKNNSINSALIIAFGVIAGLVILGLLIKKRNK